MSQSSPKIDLTTGPPTGKVLKLSIPLIISSLMHGFYNIVDTAWLGMLGKEAVAAMAFVFPVLFLIISVGIGVGLAGSILVAQYEGAGNKKMVNYSAAQTLTFSVFLALIISVGGYFTGGSLVKLMGADTTVALLAESYLKVIFSGVIFMFYFFVFSALMRGWGNTKTPMKIMVFSNLLNIGLDPVLIFGLGFIPPLGIKGAALATVFSRAVASILGLYILFKGRYALTIRFRELKPDFDILFKIFKVGWPVTLEHAIRSLGFMVITAIIAGFGTVYTAAYGIGIRIFSFIIMPSLAIGMGVAAGVGQNLGAGLVERAKRITREVSCMVFIFLSVIAVGLYFGSSKIITVFIRAGGSEVVGAGSDFLKRLAVMAPFIGAAITMRGGFKGAGRTKDTMLLGLGGLWAVRIPLAYFLSIIFKSPIGIWNAFIVGAMAELIFSVIYYYKADWAVPVVESAARKKAVENGLPEEGGVFRT